MALTANAGPDQTVGTFVPVILDGSASNDSGSLPITHFWKQTTGAAIDFVGFDRVKPIVIGANPAGTYVFTLTVDNGTITATDTVTITVVNPTGTIRYVDNLLTADTATYSIANRNGTGTDGNGYKTLAAAALVVAPGDKVYIRAGTYIDDFVPVGVYVNVVKILISGTATNPIRWQNYNGEYVILRGSGSFSDLDANLDGRADGVAHPSKRETLIQLNANYNQIVGLELTNSELVGLDNTGSFNYVAEVHVHDCWYGNFYFNNLTATNQSGNVYRYVEAHHSRHGSGMLCNVYSAGVARWDHNVIVDSLFYKNGFEATDIKVLPCLAPPTSDPAGGGNSGGSLQSKYFYDTNPLVNRGVNNYLVRNFSYHNSDDGFATATDDLLMEDNISIGNGPTGGNGVKFYKPGKNTICRGMVSYANLHRGWELRGIAATTFKHFQNTALRNWQFGVWSDTIATYDVRNTLSGFNVQADFTTITVAGKNDWGEDGTGTAGLSGDPLLVNSNLGSPALVDGRDALYPPGNEADNSLDYPGFFIDLNWPAGSTIAAKLAYVREAIKVAFSPATGSPLINAGQLIAGYHCPTADDDAVTPADPADPRRHWFGAAPDIGAYEKNPGYVPPPPPPPPPAIPVITSERYITVVQNVPVLYQITATNNPTSFGATGMPAGLTVDPPTGRFLGRVINIGVTSPLISATNTAGTGNATLVITCIAGPPAGGEQISVFQSKFYADPAEPIDYADLDAVARPVATFNTGSIGSLQLKSTAIATKIGWLGGPGRVGIYTFPVAFYIPGQVHYSSKLGEVSIIGVAIGDPVLVNYLVLANDLPVKPVFNLVFFGVVRSPNVVTLYALNNISGGTPPVIPAGSILRFRVFSFPS